MQNIFSHNPKEALSEADFEILANTEWLVTNGLGGYASGTVGGTLTRVFHGYLIAALKTPLGRTMMMNQLLEELVFQDGEVIPLNGLETEDSPFCGSPFLSAFRMDGGLPV